MDCTVTEFEVILCQSETAQDRSVCDLAQAQYEPWLSLERQKQLIDLEKQEWLAIEYFLVTRTIVRRHTLNGVGDPAIVQVRAIHFAIPEPSQSFKQQSTRLIASEWLASFVCAVQTGCKPHNKESPIRIANWSYRSIPIVRKPQAISCEIAC